MAKKLTQVLLKDGHNLSRNKYDEEYEKQHMLYGQCFVRQAYDKFNNCYVSEIIDYTKIYKALDLPAPRIIKNE